MPTDFAHEARSHRSTAAGYTRRARRDAEQAASWYELAADMLASAAWLTGRPQLWRGRHTPAGLEDIARSYTQLADTYLRSSFNSTGHAAFYRELAAEYASWGAGRQVAS